MCRHAVASLIAYKAEFAKEVPEIAPQEELQGRKFAALNINSILNNLTKEDLKTFVKAYASNDKKFSTSFKVHFARRVDLQDNEKKYKSILDSIIRPVSSDKNPFKASDVRSLLNVADEFLSQADDEIAMGQFYEAYLLIKTTIVKLCYTLHYAPYAEVETEKLINGAHIKIRDIIINNESVDLKNEIIDFLIELSQLSYYPYLELTENAIALLMRLKALPEEVNEIFTTQIKRKVYHERQVVIILALKMKLAFDTDKSYSIDKKLYNLLDKIAEQLFKNEFYVELEEFAQFHRGSAKDVALYHLQSLQISKSKKLITEAANYFLEGKDLRIIELIKQKNTQELFEKLKQTILKSKSKLVSNPSTYLQYLYKSESFDELLKFHEEKKDFKFLMIYDAVLLKHFPSELTSLYEAMVEDYLDKHVGEQSHQFINDLFIHLNKIKATKIVNKIGLMIEMKFPHRSKFNN
jgi:hypothetical protein